MQIHKKKGGGNGSRSSTSPASSLLNGRAYQAIAQAGFPRTVFGADGAGGGLRRRTSDLCRGVPGVSRDSPAPSPPPPPFACRTPPTLRQAGNANRHAWIVPVRSPVWVGVPGPGHARSLLRSWGGRCFPGGSSPACPFSCFKAPRL